MKRLSNIFPYKPKHYVNIDRLRANFINIYMHAEITQERIKAQISQGISMIQCEQTIH